MTPTKEFEVRKLYEGGVTLPTNFLSKIAPIPVIKEIFQTDGEQFLKYPPPKVMQAHGPKRNVITWQGYNINKYSFYTKAQDDKSTMQNNGVTLRAESQHFATVHDDNPCVASIPYFGFIDEIWELNYVKFTVCVFKCKWVDSNTGVRTDDVGFTLVDLKKLVYQNDPFIMAEQAKQVFYVQDPCDERTMATPPASPPPPLPPPPADASATPSTLKRTRKVTWLRSLATRPPGAERPVVNIDPATSKADGPHKKKLRTYLGIVARDKVDVTYDTWKEVPTAQKDLIWEDIQVYEFSPLIFFNKFEIPEASDSRTKKKILQIVDERWRQFRSNLTRKWALVADKDDVDDIVCEKYGISKEKWAQFCQTRRDPSWEDVRKKAQASQKQNTAPHVLSRGGYEYLEEKLMAEKTKKKLEEAAQFGSTESIIDPPSPIRRHVKWKMARMKKTGQMTSEAAKEIADRIASQGSFVPHGRQDILAATIGRPEHPGRARVVGAGVTIKQYFGSASRTSRNQLEESITEKVTRKMMASFSQMQSQFQSQMQSQGLALPPEPKVGPSGPRVSTKESCVAPSGNDPGTSDSDKCGLYIEENPSRLVALGRLYEGSTTVHNIPLLHGQVKVGVEEVKDAEALVPVPTNEVTLVGQTLNTFLAWPTHLVKRLSEHAAMSPAKPPESLDEEVDDPLYLMTLTIPQLFLKPLQVMWDATIFGVFNQNFPLYIKHEDLSEIAHGGQCLSISVIQFHLTETSVRAGNSDVYGFVEPQSIQRSGQSQFESESYIKSWIQSSK
ncbi:Linoleate 9S-lipoxygenase-4 [Glycine soja]